MGLSAARHSALCGGAFCALSAVIVLGWADPASAHAAAVSSSPLEGAHLGHATHAVTIAFDQPVQPDDGGLVVLDSGGQAVQTGWSHPRAELAGGDAAVVARIGCLRVELHRRTRPG